MPVDPRQTRDESARLHRSDGHESPAETAVIDDLSVSLSSDSFLSVRKATQEAPSFDGLRQIQLLNGRYELRRVLGEGGFGCVFYAWDRTLHRAVAVKIPKPRVNDDTATAENFLAEARIAAQLNHPNIVKVYDSGRTATGVIYVVMEYVGGSTLSARLKEGPLTVLQAVRIMRASAEAVGAAHKLGLVHRDLKPANILLDAEDRPRVADFGLAIHESEQVEHGGEVSGSPSYMSPEQVRGEVQFLDGRTDIWSLGVVLYQMLTAAKPFLGKDANQLFDQILRRPARPLRQINERIPSELEAVCLKCLNKDIEQRYSSAAALAEDLGEILKRMEGAETVARPTPPQVWNPMWLAATSLVMVCLMVTGAIWSLRNQDDAAPRGVLTPPGANDAESKESGELLIPEKGKLTPLFTRMPREIIWPRDRLQSSWRLDKDVRRLRIEANDLALLGLAKVDSDNFTLRCDFHQATWTGGIGMFFGYQGPDSATGDNGGYSYYSVTLRQRLAKGEVDPFVIDVSHVTGGNTAGFRFSEDSLGQYSVPEPQSGYEHRLEIHLETGKLNYVRWNNVHVPLPRAVDLPEPTRGAIGIISRRSTAHCAAADIFVAPSKE